MVPPGSQDREREVADVTKSERAPIHDDPSIEDDAGRRASTPAAVWTRVAEACVPVLGTRGLDAVFERCLRRIRDDYAWLEAAAPRSLDPQGLQDVLGARPDDEADRAHAALLDCFEATLTNLLGDELARTLLQGVRSTGSEGAPAAPSSTDPARSLATEVVEQLVVTALWADAAADAALRNLSELVRAGQRDPLTATPNRAVFLDRLSSAIALSRRRESSLALLFIDLDDFKEVNDTLGHPVGDEVLRLVARRLTAAVRNSDSVCRYGGDEFLVLLPDVATAEDAVLIANEILGILTAPATVTGHPVTLRASVGVSLFPDDADDTGTLIGRADAAMYHVKRNRTGGVYHPVNAAAKRARARADSVAARRRRRRDDPAPEA
jgi:diguanylate cyclase (GGDEF)-like protein